MNTTFLIVAGLLTVVVVFGVWRLLSHRHALPCPSWLGWMVELDNPFTSVNRARNIIATVKPQPGSTVLDAGCGPGRLTIPLAQMVGPHGKVYAVDIQQTMLDRVREKALSAGLENISYLPLPLGEGKLTVAGIDCAFLVTVIGEIPGKAEALREVFDALVPGGLLAITEVIFDPHFTSQQVIRELCSSAGFVERHLVGKRYAYTVVFEKP